uniref:hypothetical protein n=1 Tax=Paractinoplanes polyasparticus TaxID=2856853 RepID=UPI001C85447C|nr:hypothetical protein [Actinoplanes polyasparticus]
MIRHRNVRRGVLLTLLASLCSVPVVVTGATAASAAACTGRLTSSPNSVQIVGYQRKYGYTATIVAGQTTNENANDPVDRFRIFPGGVATVEYWHLVSGRSLGTHYNVIAGNYWKDVCHRAFVTVS